MTYDDAVAVLAAARRYGIHPSLEGIQRLAHELGDPQDCMPVIQVGGTNGKGSTSRMIAALLTAEGLHTGLFSSPRLETHLEQYRIDGRDSSPEAFAAAMSLVAPAAARIRPGMAEDFTEFELATALALVLFERAGVDVSVLEVGLGGKWDATSVVTPVVAVLTSVGLDHCEQLGPTIADIAADKVQIAKPGSKVVVGPGFAEGLPALGRHLHGDLSRVTLVGEPVDGFPRTARYRTEPARHGEVMTGFSVETPRAAYRGLAVPGPEYQARNAALAIVAAEEFLQRPLDPAAVAETLRAIRFPGRFELFTAGPTRVVVDGAHNPHAAAALAEAVRGFFGEEKPTLVMGMLADKDCDGVIEALAPVVGDVYCGSPDSVRRLDAEELCARWRAVAHRSCSSYPTVTEALNAALASRSGGLLVAGSLVTAAEARRVLGGLG